MQFKRLISICLLHLVLLQVYGQDSLKLKYFLQFSNFKPDLGFTTKSSFDIPDNLNIRDVDPTNVPGHSIDIGLKKPLKVKTFLTVSVGGLKATQIKEFLNYRRYQDSVDFGFQSFYLIGQSYEHRRVFFNTSLQQFIIKGLFIEPGIKISADVSSRKQNTGYSFYNQPMQEAYAATFYNIPLQTTNVILFYNLRFGYQYKSFAATFLVERNLNQVKRTFELRGIKYTEKQPFWRNVGFGITYIFDKKHFQSTRLRK